MTKTSRVAASPTARQTAKPASKRTATPARKRSERSATNVAIATELAPAVAIALLDKTERSPGAPAPALDVLAVAAAPSEVDGNVRMQLMQLHSAHDVSALPVAGRRVLILGGGNSGAQFLAEVSQVAEALVGDREATELFARRRGRSRAVRARDRTLARPAGGPARRALAGRLRRHRVVPPVLDARARGVLHSREPFARFTPNGVQRADGSGASFDAVICCPEFRPALSHLAPLGVIDGTGRVDVEGTRGTAEPRFCLAGYGDWTGMAWATLIGVMRTARSTAHEVDASLTPR